MLSLDEWHQRYTQQAGWTSGLRRYIFEQLETNPSSRWLEVGCGTGAVLQRLPPSANANSVFGLDIAVPTLHFCRKNSPNSLLTCGDVLDLPYARATFDVVVCHFLLLWLDNPVKALMNMAAVTRPGGYVVILAEPDHSSRIDYPPPLDELGQLQTRALENQGADPCTGRRLGQLLRQAGLQDIHTGVLGGEWRMDLPDLPAFELEWKVLAADMKDQAGPQQLAEFRRLDWSARQRGERILFIPTFYGWGKVM